MSGSARSEVAESVLADALFGQAQRRVLGLLFGQPDRRFQSAEVIRWAESGTGAVHRVLQRLVAAGLVTVTRVGNQKHYQANRESPIFPELHGLVIKTVGIVGPLRAVLEPLREQIRAAFVYGSLAKGTDRATSDLDLLVIADDVSYADLYPVLQEAEEKLRRPVNPTLMTTVEWRGKQAQTDSFAARIAEQPKHFVIGTEDDLT